MSRTFGLRTVSDLFAKLEREAGKLRQEVSSDDFFNFVVTAYSLADWIQNDPSVDASAIADLHRFRSSPCIRICRDLANSSKHFILDPRRNPTPKVESASSDQGFGMGRFGFGDFGLGEEQITVVLTDGETLDGLQFVDDVLREWKLFFDAHGI